MMPMKNPSYDAFDLLSTAILLINEEGCLVHLNAAAENLLGFSATLISGHRLSEVAGSGAEVDRLIAECRARLFSVKRLQMAWQLAGRGANSLDTTVSIVEEPGILATIELREPDAFQRIDREERQAALMQMNQSLLRNLGHEVKNPLGGIRGAAQLLDAELPTRALKEYTEVIIKESDRLQALVDQMLAPVRRSLSKSSVNIHEVLEHVRRLMLSEFPKGLEITRDYDTSLPNIQADSEQLIQMVLNIVRNAAQALEGSGCIWLKTRVSRQVTLHRRRYRLALSLSIRDNGPGIPESIREEIFYPLVSGNPKGHGLGLTIAQTIVHQHGGVIDCRSEMTGTEFLILMPLGEPLPAQG
jgi:two-component system nitrogen regulation sensor histidine kinase GlnL